MGWQVKMRYIKLWLKLGINRIKNLPWWGKVLATAGALIGAIIIALTGAVATGNTPSWLYDIFNEPTIESYANPEAVINNGTMASIQIVVTPYFVLD